MNYTQKLYVIDEDKYRRLKAAQQMPSSDEAIKTFSSQFIQNKISDLVNEDNSWARMGSRVQPILQPILEASLTPKGTPTIPPSNNQTAKPPSPSISVKTKSSLDSQSEAAETLIRSSVDKKIAGKCIRLLRYLQNLPGISVQGDKFSVGGALTKHLLVEILEDLVRNRNALGTSIDSILTAVSNDSSNISNLIGNKEAKQKISEFRAERKRRNSKSEEQTVGEESDGQSSLPSPARKELSFTPQKSPASQEVKTPVTVPKELLTPKSGDVRESDRQLFAEKGLLPPTRKYPKVTRTPTFARDAGKKPPLTARTPPGKSPLGAKSQKRDEKSPKNKGYHSFFFPS